MKHSRSSCAPRVDDLAMIRSGSAHPRGGIAPEASRRARSARPAPQRPAPPRRRAILLAGAVCGLAAALPLSAADAPPWEGRGGVPAESGFLLDRLDEPQNHFQLNGEEGFVAGREFHQNAGEAAAFLWPTHPFLRFGSDRRWETDSSILSFSATGSNAPGEGPSPFAQGDIAWSPLEPLRLHAAFDQNALYSLATQPSRGYIASPGKEEKWAWFGSDAPLRSQAALGGAFTRRGATLGVQANEGWWWTTSPVSGKPHPWQGFNFDMLYQDGEGFALSLAEQRWDSPSPYLFEKSHWRRSEVNLSFLGASQRSWTWRLDVGFENRAMSSRGAFRAFEEKTYPFRFRYRQDWTAPDSLPFRLVSQGFIGYREGVFQAQHGTEIRETFGPHQPLQYLKAYYRYAFRGVIIPTEYLSPDSQVAASYAPGRQTRGVVAGAEYRETRAHFQAGLGADYAMEWEPALFRGSVYDTVAGLARRQGGYSGSDAWVANAGGRVFASGDLGSRGYWKGEAGLRRFGGPDADSLEFLPSPWWATAGAGYALPWKGEKTRLDARIAYVGPKEVRHWGPVFKVRAHPENHFSLSQTLFSERIKVTAAALHAFGEDFREHPNGNPIRFRVAAGIDGTFD